MKRVISLALVLCMVLAYTSVSAETWEFRTGDANLDGLVTTGDATAILRYTVGISDLPDEALIPADCNGDGLVNTGDAVSILYKSACRIMPETVKSRTFVVYGMEYMSSSSDWVAYSWIEAMHNDRKTAEVIYSAASRADLDKFTDPGLCPFELMDNGEESGTLPELTERYDDAFFAENDIVFLAVHEPVTAKSVTVSDVSVFEGKTVLGVLVSYPEIAMQASQDHFIIVEIPKAYTEGREITVEAGSAVYHG